MLIALAYAVLLIAYRWGWSAIPKVQTPIGYVPKMTITMLIPARNEAGNMEACLRSVLEGSYPHNLMEIIVLDDFSEDKTAEIVQQLSQNAQLSGRSLEHLCLADHLSPEARVSPNKKKAIELGIARAKGEIIVTTDADCIVPKDWLRHIAYAFENAQIKMVCGPVGFHHEKSLLQRFQSLDFLGLMGITGAGYQLGWHQMANGANLAYRKAAFESVDGYAGNEHLASGDDMFLVHKIAKRWPCCIAFLKNHEATVWTEAAPDLHSFWQQRLRWGTKNTANSNWPLRLSLLTVFLFCWSIWVNLALVFFCLLTGKDSNILWIFLFQIAVKAFFDYFFLSEMCRFFNRKNLLRWFWPSFFMHTVYIPLVGTASIFLKKYHWKGRHAN